MSDELIPGVFRLDLGMVNAFLVDDRGDDVPDPGVTLVDAGTPGRVADLRAELADTGYRLGDVDRVLVTHYDFDHVGGIAPLGLAAPVYVMEPDASYLDGAAKPTPWNHKGLLQRVTGRFLSRPATPSHRIRDGDSVGGFVAHHTPGHSPGHTVFVHETRSVAMLGDLVFGTGGGLDEPPWFVCYDSGTNAASIRLLAQRALGFDVAAMGHGDPLEVGGADALQVLADRID